MDVYKEETFKIIISKKDYDDLLWLLDDLKSYEGSIPSTEKRTKIAVRLWGETKEHF